jgi:hypothetical protein
MTISLGPEATKGRTLMPCSPKRAWLVGWVGDGKRPELSPALARPRCEGHDVVSVKTTCGLASAPSK